MCVSLSFLGRAILTSVLFAHSWELPTPQSPGLLVAAPFVTSISAIIRMHGLEHELLLMRTDIELDEDSFGWVSGGNLTFTDTDWYYECDRV